MNQVSKLFKTLCFFLFFSFVASNLKAQEKYASTKTTTTKKVTGYTYKILECNNSTFGYNIYSDGRLLIHQPSVPSVSGNNGFSTKAGAEKVAGLVIKKIQQGEMPPAVTVKEMKALKAL